MSRNIYSDVCEHKNQIIDDHEGSYICLDCAKVLDNVYISSFEYNNFDLESNGVDTQENVISSEISHRLNIPNLNIKDEKNNIKSVSKLYLNANKNNFTVTLKEMSAVSGFSSKQIGKEIKNTVNILDISTLLEKYCKLLSLDYKSYSVIKENITKYEQTGHNPLTIVGSHIYIHIKNVKKEKISMKKVCDTIGISSISIQRYLKTIK